MTNIVEFPGLGIELTVSSVAFRIFGVPIYWYGVLIGLGMLLAVAFALSQAKGFGIDPNRMIDVIIIGIVCGVLGARIYYIIFSDGVYDTLYSFFNLRGGGLAIYGGVIGGAIGCIVGCKWRKVPLLPMMDLVGMGFLIGQSIGRWGNFTNQEAFGSNTDLPWGMISPATTAFLKTRATALTAEGVNVLPDMPVHPTFLYESLWCALGFLLLFLYRKHRKFNGEIALLYVVWYGLGRFFIEGLRTDSLMIAPLGIRVSQLLAAASVLLAGAIWAVARAKTAGKPLKVPEIPPRTAVVRVETDARVERVEISWPYDRKEPTRAERLEMAKEVLAEREADEDGADGKEAAEKDGEADKDVAEAPGKSGKSDKDGKDAKGSKDGKDEKDNKDSKGGKDSKADAGDADAEDGTDDEEESGSEDKPDAKA